MSTLTVKRSLLLELAHINNYAIAFNSVNEELNAIQTRHFGQAGKKVEDLRDPFIPYTEGEPLQRKLFRLCGIRSDDEIYTAFKNKTDLDLDVVIDDAAWLDASIRLAIRFYNERYMFFMLDDEFTDDLNRELGQPGVDSMKEELHHLLNTRMLCGSADDARVKLKAFLTEQDRPYDDPPAPYMAKYNARFADFIQLAKEACLTSY